MTTCYNPSLSEEAWNQPIRVIPPLSQETILGWLESIGRLKPHEADEFQDHKVPEDLDDFLDSEIQILDDDDDEEEPIE
jgi:hypothetical protein